MDDGARPHRFPQNADGTYPGEVLAWRCQACGHIINEFGPMDETTCPVDWRRSSGGDFPEVSRFEVIDQTSDSAVGPRRVMVRYGVSVRIAIQNGGRTMKVFLTDHPTEKPEDVRRAHTEGLRAQLAADRETVIERLAAKPATPTESEASP